MHGKFIKPCSKLQMMRILFITPTFHPKVGGSETVIYHLSHNLAALGHQVAIITPYINGAAVYEVIEQGVQVHRVDFLRVAPYTLTSLNLSVLRKALSFKKEHYDLINQFHVYPLGGSAVFAKWLLKLPLITSLMGWDTYDPYRLAQRAFKPYIAWATNCSDTVTSPSLELARRAKEQGYRGELTIIPLGVDLDRFSAEIDGENMRTKLGIEKDELMVLAVQRLERRKRLDYLISAIPHVIRKNPKVKFVIAGEGGEKDKLKTLADKLGVRTHLLFAGYVTDKALPSYYAASDIFVLHTFYESFGIVLAEAMACGKPVISTRVGAVPEVIDDCKNGLLVPPADSQELAAAILKLAANHALRAKLGAMGRRKAINEYSWATVTKRYVELYEVVLDG